MSDWPLHITFADVFAIDRHSVGIDEKIEKTLRSQKQAVIEPKQRAKLGDTEVILVEKTDEVLRLHMLMINLLEQNGAVFNTPAFTKNGFLPHCTIQKSGTLQDRSKITELSLVDMFPDNNWKLRRVLATFKLSG